MNLELQNLASFLGAYFNQDWPTDYPDMGALVEDFRCTNPKWFVSAVIDELGVLIATSDSDENIGNILAELGCYLVPQALGMTNRQWIEWLLRELQR